MNRTTRTLAAMFALLFTAATTAQAGHHKGDHSEGKAYDKTAKSIVEIASGSEDFETLTAALTAAGLVDALSSDGPFTVFAPTDDAFAALPAGVLEDLLKPESLDALTAILTFHVVDGRLPSGRVLNAGPFVSLNGQRLEVTVGNDEATIEGAVIVKTDIKARNGVIHVIDAVMLPELKNNVEVAEAAGDFGTLLAAAQAAGLAETLATGGPFTILAPTDEAFANLPPGTVDMLLLPENKDQLAAILKYHVIEGRIYSDQAPMLKNAETLSGLKLEVDGRPKDLSIGNATVVAKDIETANGVIHVIDEVLLP